MSLKAKHNLPPFPVGAERTRLLAETRAVTDAMRAKARGYVSDEYLKRNLSAIDENRPVDISTAEFRQLLMEIIQRRAESPADNQSEKP